MDNLASGTNCIIFIQTKDAKLSRRHMYHASKVHQGARLGCTKRPDPDRSERKGGDTGEKSSKVKNGKLMIGQK